MTAHRTLKTPEDLADTGLLEDGLLEDVKRVSERYAVAVTPTIAKLIDPLDPHDPIARQFVPDVRELNILPQELADPIGDKTHSPVKGVVHRYPDRVLLKAVHVCPVYCRFCFRREVVGPAGEGTLSPEDLAQALSYIKSDSRIWEVILTGGDPLVMSPRRLREIMLGLKAIEHVKIVRLHTRVPVVDPAIITEEMIEALLESDKTVYVAIHANHPRELTSEARSACERLAQAGIALVSQTVLLKGVNDDPDVLADLMRAFVETRIKPYYLHHPDLAPGTSHFRLDIAEGQRIVAALRGRVSGLCQPTYVLDVPGGHGKSVISASSVEETASGAYAIRDYRGHVHIYPPTNTSEEE